MQNTSQHDSKNFISKNKGIPSRKARPVDPYFEFKRALNKNLENLQSPSPVET
jgi:hypothetical protein